MKKEPVLTAAVLAPIVAWVVLRLGLEVPEDATLLDPANLVAGLAAGVARHDEADRLRRDRLAAIDAELAKQRKRLDGLAGRLVDAGDGELYAALLRQAKGIAALIGRLGAERRAG